MKTKHGYISGRGFAEGYEIGRKERERDIANSYQLGYGISTAKSTKISYWGLIKEVFHELSLIQKDISWAFRQTKF